MYHVSVTIDAKIQKVTWPFPKYDMQHMAHYQHEEICFCFF